MDCDTLKFIQNVQIPTKTLISTNKLHQNKSSAPLVHPTSQHFRILARNKSRVS